MTAIKQTTTKKQYSLEAYYQFQDEISAKSLIVDGQDISRVEYNNGEILFMAGGIINHSIISVNMISSIGALLKNTKCRPFGAAPT